MRYPVGYSLTGGGNRENSHEEKKKEILKRGRFAPRKRFLGSSERGGGEYSYDLKSCMHKETPYKTLYTYKQRRKGGFIVLWVAYEGGEGAS